MKKWTKDDLTNIGNSVAQMGVPVVWQKWGVEPSEKIKTDEGDLLQIDAMMRAISDTKGLSITHARRSIEDVVAMATKTSAAQKEWLVAILRQMEKWHCSQSWFEKNLKKLVENSAEGSAIKALEEWKGVLASKEQVTVWEALHAYYTQQDQKKSKKKEKTSTKNDGFLGLVNFASVWARG
jgi:hypothetical protein